MTAYHLENVSLKDYLFVRNLNILNSVTAQLLHSNHLISFLQKSNAPMFFEKKMYPANITNYRLITILPAKIMEEIIHVLLSNYILVNNKFPSYQSQFFPSALCNLQLVHSSRSFLLLLVNYNLLTRVVQTLVSENEQHFTYLMSANGKNTFRKSL